jgi:DNA-binding CsgD family transcriptional regulator
MGRPRTGVLLTAAETQVLFLLANGLTYGSVATRRGVHVQTVKNQGASVIRKLGARNMTDAVRIAILDGILGRYPDCGTDRAYQRHRRRLEQTDPKCLKAHNARRLEQRRSDRNKEEGP